MYVYIYELFVWKLLSKHSWTIYNNVIHKTELVEAVRDMFEYFS